MVAAVAGIPSKRPSRANVVVVMDTEATEGRLSQARLTYGLADTCLDMET